MQRETLYSALVSRTQVPLTREVISSAARIRERVHEQSSIED